MTDEQREDLSGQILKPADLVGYQTGSVVSRMMVFKKSGTITLFAFDQGEGLSEHTAPYDAIVMILEGEARITIEGEPFTLTAGEMMIMPAEKPHAVEAVSRFKMMLTMIHA
ncbi:cupin domain-containing protein [Methanosphaerula palustris]|uniref:Cupin 2 conserved barrel domain protein n=1 Tax=Methanosphaerula palustris (strain ATCC BAA-1556 / DSM 19958 / E1-9c) TaxID=521011 RepID=B8GJ49_METPE|nr:cupin domain-containing protein [Methanosphaerula palustris]ACL15622.1 Cupin 2 conserved barrel domain protein [Methanosphaerula palustris E1-9c]